MEETLVQELKARRRRKLLADVEACKPRNDEERKFLITAFLILREPEFELAYLREDLAELIRCMAVFAISKMLGEEDDAIAKVGVIIDRMIAKRAERSAAVVA